MGLPFPPSGRGFDRASDDLGARCPELENDRYTQALWLFAETTDGPDRYLMVGGYFVPRRAGDEAIANPLGTLIRLSPAGCTLLGPAAELFAMPEAYADSVSSQIASALAADAARRIIAAHGDAKGFETAMERSGKRLNEIAPLLQDQVNKLLDAGG